ncbi:hypothetical protein CMI41_00465 [Candidatus Pacearchaeota archaeon]|nr:hypothetical protein [Candidatus Pacearchaeota archaeon]|tara:strand:- start:5596 stop:6108 length:513 start_codon:yes stop_codon:yes gene_type:complete
MEVVSPEKETEFKSEVDEKGNLILKKKENIKRGGKSRSSGSQFELRVRKDLAEKGFVVDKWTNNVDLESESVIPAKRKFNPFNKVMTIGTGFPDFVCFQRRGDLFQVIGVEVKQNNTLSKVEKQKCKTYLEKGVFNEIWVASKDKEGRRVKVIYEDFVDKYKRWIEKNGE